jgi:hypothetical protein
MWRTCAYQSCEVAPNGGLAKSPFTHHGEHASLASFTGKAHTLVRHEWVCVSINGPGRALVGPEQSSEIKDAGYTKVDPPDVVMWGSIAETRGEHARGQARP